MHHGEEDREGGEGLLRLRPPEDPQGHPDGVEVASSERGERIERTAWALLAGVLFTAAVPCAPRRSPSACFLAKGLERAGGRRRDWEMFPADVCMYACR